MRKTVAAGELGRRLGSRATASWNSAGARCIAAIRNPLFWTNIRFANLESQMRTAFSNIVSNTCCRVFGDELMMRRTSPVAFCC